MQSVKKGFTFNELARQEAGKVGGAIGKQKEQKQKGLMKMNEPC